MMTSNRNILVLFSLVSWAFIAQVSAQSHFQGLAQAWREQNPQQNAAPRPAQGENRQYSQPVLRVPYQGPQPAPMAQAPYNAAQPVTPEPAPYRAVLAPEYEIPLTASVSEPYRQLGQQPGRSAPQVGNPKDPLNVHFVPEPPVGSNRPVTPYDEMLQDARLNDVFFVDGRCGWAVGDRGAIWHTEDGGQNWALQETPIDCTLRSVHFLNETIGLAVGGYLYPLTSQGRGVILITSNGGKSWSLLPAPYFPVLHRVKMFDLMKGLLAGESSEYCPSGLFATNDGGRSWRPVSGDKGDGWMSADFLDEKTGVGIGRDGNVQTIDATKLAQIPATASARFKEIRLIPGAATPAGGINGWMVGESGLVLSTSDRGLRWSVTLGKLPGNAATMIDLETIAFHGNSLWVAGNPGSFIYTSPDQGKTWKAVPTGTPATIRKIVFTDAKNGWAVGEFGTVLATVDGGASWKTQRAAASRMALLGVFSRAEDIPLEAFVQLCANQGYLGGVQLLFRDDDKRREGNGSPWLDRVHEALLRTGACGVRETGPFTLPRSETLAGYDKLVEQIQKENDGKGLQRMRERLVLAIRQWTPEIILTSDLGEAKRPDRELLLREILGAVEMAGDPTAFPYQITELALKPWKVKKIHLALDGGVRGDVNIWTTEPLVRLGQPIDELAYVPYGIIRGDWKPTAPILGFSTQRDESPATGNRDFFAGIDLPPGGDGRRNLYGTYADRWEEINHRIQQRRHVLGILQNMTKVAEANGRSKSDVRLASNAAELTRKIDRDAAVQVLLDMGRQYHALGDWDSALEAYDLLAKQHGTHPLSRQAFLWLLQYHAAEETGWRKHCSSVNVSSDVVYNKDGTVTSLENREPSLDRHKLDPRLDRAIEIGRYLDENDPELASDAGTRFALASAQRRRGWGREAAEFYKTRGGPRYDDVWSMRARAEYWLSVEDKSELPLEQRESPLPSIFCSFTSVKPYLDGQFDKQYDRGTWFKSKLFTLTPEKPRRRLQEIVKNQKSGLGVKREERSLAESKNFGTQVMFMYDKQYLYVGIRCKRAAGFSYPPIAERPRSRDAKIDDQDRVEILLDVDRDYGTYYSLTVDSRGWVVDACWDDKSWNPNWYVARNDDKDFWYIEAAIPLDSLTDRTPMPQTIWAVGIRRMVPGLGIECWNAENSFDLAEGFGFLVFE